MNTAIKVIPTEYRGQLFRSRTEARWAMFFELAGIAWEYEPEAYVGDDGTAYLPDFFLPDASPFEGGPAFFEVKPGDPHAFVSDEVYGKALIASQATGHDVVIAFGPPAVAFHDNPYHGPEGHERISTPLRNVDSRHAGSDRKIYPRWFGIDFARPHLLSNSPDGMYYPDQDIETRTDHGFWHPDIVGPARIAATHRFWEPSHA